MSYISSHKILEQREVIVDLGAHELTVHYDYEEWSEGHPYGNTTAFERLSECSEHTYLLDEVEKSYQDLTMLFGHVAVDAAIRNAEEQG